MNSSFFVIGKTQLASNRAHPSVNADANHCFRLPALDRGFSGALSGDLYLPQKLPLFGRQSVEKAVDVKVGKQCFLSKFSRDLVSQSNFDASFAAIYPEVVDQLVFRDLEEPRGERPFPIIGNAPAMHRQKHLLDQILGVTVCIRSKSPPIKCQKQISQNDEQTPVRSLIAVKREKHQAFQDLFRYRFRHSRAVIR